MAAMEHANGVRWLHDAGLKEIAKHNLGKQQKQLRQAAVQFITAYNEATNQANHDHTQPGITTTG